jgi:3-methylcrotonyl-CoA carboxylase alpha subunit
MPRRTGRRGRGANTPPGPAPPIFTVTSHTYTMIESLLIANRGEIACRIQKTCRRMGIRTIAVYSDADAGARHVLEADDAVRIGPAEAVNSYLRADAVIAAAQRAGAAAIHPGYGFLSEKAALPELCQRHGIVWVGPRAEAIVRMGSKIEAKGIAEQAGVRSVPGYHGENQAPVHLLAMAADIGFPVLIKASAGGGGKGMRRVNRADEFLGQLLQAKQEALRAFNDERVLIEKLIARPRHLEVQLAGDHHGNLIHLFERECSIQRNYQKVIEEAPAAHLSDTVRARLFEQALLLGRHIAYDSIGTVEFVLEEGSDMPYFLEMNTRLQVEHPVTEQIVGIDLVELQLRIAAGETLPFAQDAIQARGWAIEARINCEDPAKNYQPQIGTVGAYREPDTAGIRVDSGIGSGSVISPYYDSMIAKIIGFGANRATAARRLDQGLAQFEAAGIGTNQAFLRDLLARPAFHAAPLTTLFMAEQFPHGWQIDPHIDNLALAAAAWHSLFPAAMPEADTAFPWQKASGFRTLAAAGRSGAASVHVESDRAPAVHITLTRCGPAMLVGLNGATLLVRFERLAADTLRVISDALAPVIFSVTGAGPDIALFTAGMRWEMRVEPSLKVLARPVSRPNAGQGQTKSGMPGLITAVHVAVGQEVEVDEIILVMEAMKLIHSLRAEIKGVVSAVYCAEGDTVAAGLTLIEIDPV